MESKDYGRCSVILGFVLTMCNRSGGNNKTSNSSNANADETSTVSVSSLPSITLANVGPNAISQTMLCYGLSLDSGVNTYTSCDASDDTVLSSYSITHDEAFAAGWKLVGPGCSNGSNSGKCILFHK